MSVGGPTGGMATGAELRDGGLGLTGRRWVAAEAAARVREEGVECWVVRNAEPGNSQPLFLKTLADRTGRGPQDAESRLRILVDLTSAAARSQPRFVLPILDHGVRTPPATLCLVTPLSGGTTTTHLRYFFDRLRADQTMQDRARLAATLIAQAARGLGAYHQFTPEYSIGALRGHGRLKPRNLLIFSNPDGASADTGGLDIGIDVQVTDYASGFLMYGNGYAPPEVGATTADRKTWEYAAPETFGGEPNPQSDVYSLGIILYELLTGNCPFNPLSRESLRRDHAQTPPAPLPSSIPAGLRTIVMCCLEKSEAARYGSCRALSQALVGYLHNASVQTTAGPSMPSGPPRFQMPPALGPNDPPARVLIFDGQGQLLRQADLFADVIYLLGANSPWLPLSGIGSPQAEISLNDGVVRIVQRAARTPIRHVGGSLTQMDQVHVWAANSWLAVGPHWIVLQQNTMASAATPRPVPPPVQPQVQPSVRPPVQPPVQPSPHPHTAPSNSGQQAVSRPVSPGGESAGDIVMTVLPGGDGVQEPLRGIRGDAMQYPVRIHVENRGQANRHVRFRVLPSQDSSNTLTSFLTFAAPGESGTPLSRWFEPGEECEATLTLSPGAGNPPAGEYRYILVAYDAAALPGQTPDPLGRTHLNIQILPVYRPAAFLVGGSAQNGAENIAEFGQPFRVTVEVRNYSNLPCSFLVAPPMTRNLFQQFEHAAQDAVQNRSTTLARNVLAALRSPQSRGAQGLGLVRMATGGAANLLAGVSESLRAEELRYGFSSSSVHRTPANSSGDLMPLPHGPVSFDLAPDASIQFDLEVRAPRRRTLIGDQNSGIAATVPLTLQVLPPHPNIQTPPPADAQVNLRFRPAFTRGAVRVTAALFSLLCVSLIGIKVAAIAAEARKHSEWEAEYKEAKTKIEQATLSTGAIGKFPAEVNGVESALTEVQNARNALVTATKNEAIAVVACTTAQEKVSKARIDYDNKAMEEGVPPVSANSEDEYGPDGQTPAPVPVSDSPELKILAQDLEDAREALKQAKEEKKTATDGINTAKTGLQTAEGKYNTKKLAIEEAKKNADETLTQIQKSLNELQNSVGRPRDAGTRMTELNSAYDRLKKQHDDSNDKWTKAQNTWKSEETKYNRELIAARNAGKPAS